MISSKSHIATQCSFRMREKYANLSGFWVRASSIDRFKQGYGEIARKLK